MTLGEKIEQAGKLKEKITELNKPIKELQKEYAELESQIAYQLETNNTRSVAGTSVRATLKEETYYAPDTSKWIEVWNYILRNEFYELLPKSLKSAALKELAQQNELPDLFKKHSKTKLSLSKLKVKQ